MKRLILRLLLAVLLFLAFHVSAATTRYVDANGTNPVVPYTTWATAATNIQDAINHSSFGDTVLVTNGIYQYGGDSFNGSNRVDDISSVLIQSVNGPAVTIIKGYQISGTTNGANAMRCVYLREFGKLYGFTLTGGATPSAGSGGGVTMESQCVVSNCIITGNAAANNGGGAFSGNGSVLVNCAFNGNTATSGGAAAGFGGALIQVNNCVFSNNTAAFGGAIYSSLANNCLFTGNGSTNGFGGNGTSGGAADNSALNNCTLVGNFSKSFGAADGGSLANSIIYYNTSGIYADCYQCRLTNCCTASLINSGGSVNTITNAAGFVDFANGNFHLQIGSPCVDAGTNVYAPSGNDLDGNPRITGAAVDMGTYESQYTNLPVLHYVSLTSTNPVSPYTNWITAATNIQDAVNVAFAGEMVIADSGNYTNGGTVISGSETNRVALTNGITLLGLNGAQNTTIVGGTQMRCVYVGSNSVLLGFTLTNGHTRFGGDFTNEQSGAGIWLETGGVASNCVIIGNSTLSGWGGGAFGGTIFNSTLASNSATYGGGAVYSALFNCAILTNLVNGNYGGGIYRGTASNCTFVANWAYSGGGGTYQSTLYNCVLNTNYSSLGGGGAQQCYLYNCTLAGNRGSTGGTSQSTNYNCWLLNNSANGSGGGAFAGASYGCTFIGNTAFTGGGAAQAFLYNCVVVSNTASSNGGGTYQATLYNCSVVENSSTNGSGGGTYSGVAYNSIIYYDSAVSGANYSGGNQNYCCSTPLSNGTCFTNEPVFASLAGGDFHEQTNSPTINGGNNFYITNNPPFPLLTNDLAGNPRIVGGTVDVGAYEYQGLNSSVTHVPIPWLRQYGLPTDGSADYLDSDGDGMSNWQEWIVGTSPINASSLLQMTFIVPTNNSSGVTVTWQSVSGVNYFLQRGSDLSAQPIFSTLQGNIAGQAGTTSYTDTTATNNVPYFYRVGVQ